MLQDLRNEIIYHYPEADDVNRAFEDTPPGDDWAWYPSNTINNSFYLATDFVIMTAILGKTGETDALKAFQKLMGLVTPISNDMTDLLLYVMRAIVSRRLGSKVLAFRPGTGVQVHNVPNFYKVSIPFFIVKDD